MVELDFEFMLSDFKSCFLKSENTPSYDLIGSAT